MSSNERLTNQEITPSIDQRNRTGDLVDTLRNAKCFQTLLRGVDTARLGRILAGPDLVTLFAPHDEAFSKISASDLERLWLPEREEELSNLLSRHIVKGRLSSADLKLATQLKARDGSMLPVKRAGAEIYIDGARIVDSDNPATNGMMHVIDAVLIEERVRKAGG